MGVWVDVLDFVGGSCLESLDVGVFGFCFW